MLLSKLGGERQDAADLNRKLAGTFLLVKIKKGEPEVLKCYQIAGETFTCFTKAEPHGVHYKWEDVDILSMMPESGVYQMNDSVAVVQRIPDRQNQDGATPKTLNVTLYWSNRSKTLEKFDLELMESLYKPQKDRDFNETLSELKKSGIPQRISGRFWIRNERQRLGLYRNRVRIGSIDTGRFFWTAGARIFEEELKDIQFHAKS